MTGQPEDFDADFLTGFAQLLGGTGLATFKATGAYTGNETAIIFGALPQAPARVISLASYGVDDSPNLSDSTIALQVTTRWEGQDQRDVGRLTSRVFDALHGLHDFDLPTGIHVVQCLRRSWTSLGQDQSSRWRTAQNFYVDVHRPSANRT